VEQKVKRMKVTFSEIEWSGMAWSQGRTEQYLVGGRRVNSKVWATGNPISGLGGGGRRRLLAKTIKRPKHFFETFFGIMGVKIRFSELFRP
jgi:hypothetical protein